MTSETAVRPETAPSVRRRLLVLLLLPAIGILTIGTISDYLTSGRPLLEAYDQALLDSALAIADHIDADADGTVVLNLPDEAIAILRADPSDSIHFKVTDGAGRNVAGEVDLPDLKAGPDATARGDARYLGEPIRLVSYRTPSPTGPVTITVGETMSRRDRARTGVLYTSLAVDLGELGVVLAMILIGVRAALSPMRSVEAQIGKRSAGDLSPLPLDSVPIEIRSLVQTLNELFATVRETGAAQRRFLESAAHQLRTPLAGISAQLELLTNDERDPARQQRLSAVLGGARRLAHTTQQLLTLARSDEAARLHWDFTTLTLSDLVETVVVERLAAADLAGVDLGAQIGPASVHGVEWLLHEALGNLVNNAIAYTPEGGSVTVHCGTAEGRAYLRVVDTGVGIPPAEREHVMKRFFRASNARGAGSGLGLAIVHEVAQLHGATVSIDAGSAGTGTCIELRFPAHPAT